MIWNDSCCSTHKNTLQLLAPGFQCHPNQSGEQGPVLNTLNLQHHGQPVVLTIRATWKCSGAHLLTLLERKRIWLSRVWVELASLAPPIGTQIGRIGMCAVHPLNVYA